jgi:superfamily II DNA or RNA helicase
MEEFIPWYPNTDDEDFRELIWSKREFSELKQLSNLNDKPFLYPHQLFVKRYISPYTPYKSLILFHNTGSGKTYSSIAVCEAHKYVCSKALIIVKGDTSYLSFREQITKWYKGNGIDESEIKMYFEIKKFISFSNYLKGVSDEYINIKYSNRVIVIDEVHNLRFAESYDIHSSKEHKTNQSFVYKQIWRLLHIVQNCKVLLLTATPMIDKADEIHSIMNLVLSKHTQLSAPLSFDKIEKAVRGKVSYLRDIKDMAKIVEYGILVPGCQIVVVPSIMKGYQLLAYNAIDSSASEDHVYRNSVYCSLMTLSDGSYGADAFLKLRKRKYIHEKYKYLLPEDEIANINRSNLDQFSCKYAKMIDIIETTNNELVYVFCEEVRGSGIMMLASVLECLGYTLYDGEDISSIEKQARYTIYTGDIVICHSPESRLKGFRSEKNKYGDYVKILIGSRVSGEGINLSNIRQVHVLTPHWNISTIIQAIGRAMRRNSHNMLKSSERVIKVYRHVAIVGNYYGNDICSPRKSIDMYKYKISENKSDIIQQIEELMKRNAVDYFLNNEYHLSKEDVSTYLLQYNSNPDKLPHFKPIKELHTDVYNIDRICIQKRTSLEDYYKNTYKDNIAHDVSPLPIEDEILNAHEYQKGDLINIIMKLNIDAKIRVLERSIQKKVVPLITFFDNSVTKYKGRWYHIMHYRIYGNKFSYSVSSGNFILSGKTRRLDTVWVYVTGEEEEEVMKEISKNINEAKKNMDIFSIYAIFSTGDNKVRIRTTVFEDKDKAFKDQRKVNRGRYINSYSLFDMRFIAMILFSKQIGYYYILSKAGECYQTVMNSIALLVDMQKKNLIKCTDDFTSILNDRNYDVRLYCWLITRRKSELKDLIVQTIVDNDMYIII